MDQWEALLDSYHDPPDIRDYIRVLHTAESVIKNDLAGFEIDWVIQTLLYKPIHLLDTVRSKRTDDSWTKPIGDTYKLLGEIVAKYPQNAEHWIDDIVQLCEIPLDPRTRWYALTCLSVCVRQVAPSVSRYITQIQDSTACRAPLAVLIGKICEYHPETVGDEAINIWRIYLNILDSNKNTDTVISSVLEGLLGLFKHFGMDLPVAELAKFYQKMSREFVKISKCDNVIQTILKDHSILFQNALTKDLQFRLYMWSNPDFAHVLPNVYKCILGEVNRNNLQNILDTELLPQTNNYNSYIKYAALRIIYYIHKVYNIHIDILNDLEIYTLEFEMRNQVDNYKAEAISFCLDSNLPNSEKVLQTAILFYQNLPSNKRKEIVVHTILNSTTEFMNATLNFLITESCQSNCLNTHLPLWKDILDSNLQGKKEFFVYFMGNLIFVLDMFLDGGDQKLPEKLSSLLALTSHVLTLIPLEEYTTEQCTVVSRKLVQLFLKCGVEISIVAVIRGMGRHLGEDDDFKQLFKIMTSGTMLLYYGLYETVRQIADLRDGVNVLNRLTGLMDFCLKFSCNIIAPIAMIEKAMEVIEEIKLQVLMRMQQSPLNERDMLGVKQFLLYVEHFPLQYKLLAVAPVSVRMILSFASFYITTCIAILQIYNLQKNQQNVIMLQIDRCKNEALLCEMSLALLHAPDSTKTDDVERMKHGLEVIFTRKDAESTTLSLALKKLEYILANAKAVDNKLRNIIALVKKLRNRKDLVGKEARILQRDIIMFLGKYSHFDINNNNLEEFSFAVELKDKITLDIPNTIEGVTYKVNLCRQILLAIEDQNEDALHMMLTVICASSNISSRPYQQALGALLAACGRSVENTRVVDAAFFCREDALDYIVEYLHNCSPGVRKMLCDVIEGILLQDPRSTSELMIKVTDRVIMLLSSKQLKSKQIGLDLSEALLSVLKENNELTKLKLLQLIILLTNTNETDTYSLLDKASNLLAEKIELFTIENLTQTLNKMLKNTIKREIKEPISAKNYKNVVKSAVGIIKVVCDAKDVKVWKIVEDLFDMCQNDIDRYESDKCLRIIAELGCQFDSLMVDEVMELSDGLLERMIFDNEFDDEFQLDNVLGFVCQFSDVLLRYNRQQLKLFLSNLTTNIKPQYAIYLKTQLSTVLSKCHEVTDINNLSNWTETLTLEEITNNLEKNIFVADYFDTLTALKIMIEAHNPTDVSVTLTYVNVYAQKWPRIILKMFSLGYVKHLTVELSFLTDLLTVALKFLTVADLKCLLLEGHNLKGVKNEKLGVEFCSFFMNVFGGYFLKKPFLLLDDRLTDCSVIVNEVVRLVVKKRMEKDYDSLFELIENIWPKYEKQTDFKTKQKLLLDVSFLDKKMDPESRPMKWAKNIICDENCDFNEKISLIGVLPAGEEFSTTYRKYASLLPTRLSEVRGSSNSLLRAMIDALSVNGDPTLLDIVASLAAGDSTKGWWDESFISCMANLAQSPYIQEVYNNLYKRIHEGLTTGICTRLLVPLIRYSSPTIVTNFTSHKLEELLKMLSSKRSPSQHYAYHKYVADLVRTLHVFVAVLEKIPPQHIESPSSPLYVKLSDVTKPWHLPRELGKLCCTLRDLVTQSDTHLKDVVRELQITAYNCLCACITLWRPNEKIYAMIFDLKAWEKIVDSNVEYKLPIKTQWNSTSITVATSVRSQATSGSNRTRLFLRTLSENPLLYDLIDDKEDEQVETLEITLPSTELNQHPCASTLSSLMAHVSEMGHKNWPGYVNNSLINGSRNLKWLLAQIICNIKEDLKSYGNELNVGLWNVISDTSDEVNGKKLLNGLHLDIINTLISWADIIKTPDLSHINKNTQSFVHTMVSYRDRKSTYRYLMDVFNKYIDVFDKYIKIDWNTFEEYINDLNTSKSLLPILTKLTKNKIHIPELLPNLLSKLSTNHNYQISKLAELIGLAIKCDNQKTYDVKKLLDKMRKSNINDYVKLLYYSKYCDEQQFRVIVDLAQKLPVSERNKCIEIIQTYMCEHPDSDVLEEVPADLMVLVDEKSGGKRFEEFFQTRSTVEPQAKRPRFESKSLILNTISRNEKHFNCLLDQLGKEKYGKVVEKLCTDDMSVRFTECFYICIYLPIIYTDNKAIDLSVCLSVFFEMLFQKLKNESKFKESKLRDTPLNIDNRQFTKLLTRTKTYIGTLRSHSYNTSRRNIQKHNVNTLDVQIPIEKILYTLVEFSKVSLEVSMDLLKQLFISIKKHKFESLSLMGYMLQKIVDKHPVFLDISRILVDSICEIDGILKKMEELKLSTLGSDVEHLVKLLYEDVKLRKLGLEQFVLGNLMKNETEDVSMTDDKPSFSLEDIVSSFKKLSNWNELTIRERQIQSDGLPLLWSDKDSMMNCLDNYTETTTWFGKMVSLHKNKKQDTWKWLREAERQPRKSFEISAITEAIQWYDDKETKNYELNINKKDCLIEWAARLLIRSTHLTQNAESSQIIQSRLQELIWCKRATEMELPKLTLQCIKRNTVDLYENETLPWLEQRVAALKLMGLQQNDSQLLKKALDTAEKYTPIFQDKSSLESVMGMQSLILELSYKLGTLNTTKLDTIVSQIQTQLSSVSKTSVSFDTKSQLSKLYSTYMLYHNDMWKENSDPATRNTYLKSMLPVVRNSIDFKLKMKNHFLCMLFNEIENFTEIDSEVSSEFIEMIKNLLKNQPTLFNHLLKTKLQSHPALRLCIDQETSAKMYTKCLQLIADPDYMLHRYIHELDLAIQENNPESWKSNFSKMKDKIFENPYIGTDYQPLLKYKNRLYDIEEYDITDITKKRNTLNQIKTELSKSTPTNVLRLSQICPKLSHLGSNELGLSEILGLKDEVVVKFDEQIQVYTDSVIRPCVVSALLSNGKRVKYLVKQVAMWRAAAAMTVAGMWPVCHEGYNIIPISEDCGVIQFLEDHVRLQELISKTIDLDEIQIVRQSTKEDEFILAARQTSLSNFNQICEKIPSYTLRSAIENKCISVQDFINKRHKYLDTLCSMTVFNYIFGIGDRHLDNILFNTNNGGLQIIDLDSVFQYGVCELPPARLTRNLIAVIESKVLESRLQTKMKKIRENARFLIETIKFCFQSNDEEFLQKLPYVEGTIIGTKLSNQITEDSLQKSNRKFKEKYLQLTEEVFENFDVKHLYSIEEQVSNLLLHCTDPRILSVIRSGWEPWI